MSVMGVAIRMQADAILRIIRTRERERERERESEREIGDKVTTVTEVHYQTNRVALTRLHKFS
jgi:hypothetical protein